MFYNIGQDADLVPAIHTWALAIFNSMEGFKNISSINLDGSAFRSVESPEVSTRVEISICTSIFKPSPLSDVIQRTFLYRQLFILKFFT